MQQYGIARNAVRYSCDHPSNTKKLPGRPSSVSNKDVEELLRMKAQAMNSAAILLNLGPKAPKHQNTKKQRHTQHSGGPCGLSLAVATKDKLAFWVYIARMTHRRASLTGVHLIGVHSRRAS